MNKIKIINPGLLTTIQDSGRFGYQQFGMSVAGSMDSFSQKIANMLVGNPPDEGVLETTFMGPVIEFECEEAISITGADMGPMINGEEVSMWETIFVKPGDKLSFSGLKDGIRSYIAFSKTLDVPIIMNSKSTFIKGEIGGFEGDKLKAGQEIPLGDKNKLDKKYVLDKKYIPDFSQKEISVVLGPQDEEFSEEEIEKFLSSTYKVTTESDRMGFRLEGPQIVHKTSPDIISDGINIGAIQVPGHGQPIIMMADRQTTGGYTKIANVVTSNLPIVAQMKPGTEISFKKLSIEEAQDDYLKYMDYLDEIHNSVILSEQKVDDIKRFRINIDGDQFVVEVEEIY